MRLLAYPLLTRKKIIKICFISLHFFFFSLRGCYFVLILSLVCLFTLKILTNQVRLRALCDRRLQSVLDAVVLEPAEWLRGERKPPTIVPDRARTHLKTPVGLLFNELMFSPAG